MLFNRVINTSVNFVCTLLLKYLSGTHFGNILRCGAGVMFAALFLNLLPHENSYALGPTYHSKCRQSNNPNATYDCTEPIKKSWYCGRWFIEWNEAPTTLPIFYAGNDIYPDRGCAETFAQWRITNNWSQYNSYQIPDFPDGKFSVAYYDWNLIEGVHATDLVRFYPGSPPGSDQMAFWRKFSCPKGTSGPYASDRGIPENASGFFGPYWCERPLNSVKTPELLGQQCLATPNPITFIGGNKYLAEIDVPNALLDGLEISRHYNSLGGYYTLRMGERWNLSIDRSLSFETTDMITAYRDDGRQINLVRNGDLFRPSAGGGELVSRIVEAGVITGWRYTDENTSKIEIYDVHGRLTQIIGRDGKFWELEREGGRVVSIKNAHGTEITLSYNTEHRLSRLSLPGGSFIEYVYDTNGNLVSVRHPDGSLRSYAYNETGYTSGASLPNALTSITDENGVRYLTYTYNNSNQAIGEAYINNAGAYSLAFSTNKTVVTDPLGTSKSYTYQAVRGVARNTAQVQTGSTASAAFTYDTNGNIASRTDLNGIKTTYTYDLSRNLEIQRIQASGKPEARTLSSQWHAYWRLPIKQAEPFKFTTWTFNGDNGVYCAPQSATVPRLDGGVQPLGVVCSRTEQATLDANGANGFSASLDSATQPRTWTYTYNDRGQLLTETDPSLAINYRSYYNNTTSEYRIGDLHTVTDGAGLITSFDRYDAFGRLLRQTDPSGQVTTYSYDLRGRLLTKGTGGLVTTMAYLPTGLLSSVTLPTGYAIQYNYDDAHRLIGWSDNRGNIGTYVLDGMGNQTGEQIHNSAGSLAFELSRSINSVNRVSGETLGGNQSTALTYDPNGNLATVKNALNQTTSLAVDGLSRLTQITNPLNNSASFNYNQQDAVTQAKDFKGVATNYIRDAMGNATQEVTPDAGTSNAAYDARGLLASTADATGRTIGVERDALGRITRLSYNDGSSSVLRYDLTGTTYNTISAPNASLGQLSEVQDPGVTTQYQRDALGRIVRKSQILASGETKTVAYTYVPAGQGGAGNVQSITYPSGKQLLYQYDGTGQVAAMQWAGTPLLANLQWSPLGMPSGWSWPGIAGAPGSGSASLAEARSYNTAGQLSHSAILDLSWDAAGRITAIEQSQMVPGAAGQTAQGARIASAFSYDAAGRMTASAHSLKATPAITWPGIGTGATSLLDVVGYNSMGYAYDANGNRASATIVKTPSSGTQTTTTKVYSLTTGSNVLASVSSITNPGGTSASLAYQYDATGSITSAIGLGAHYLHYGPNGRIAKVTNAASSANSSAVTYLYNSASQRLLKTDTRQGTASTEHTFYSDADSAQLLGVYSNQRSARSAAPAGEPDSTEVIYLPTAQGLLPVAAMINGRLYAIHADHLNTPRRLTNAQGQVAWQWLLTGFGEVEPTTGAGGYVLSDSPAAGSIPSYAPELKFDLRYPGQQWDDETGLTYNINRYYDSTSGRYIQADPIGLDGGWNRFEYVGSNPLNYTDPQGLFSPALAVCAAWPVGTAVCAATGAAVVWGIWTANHNNPPAPTGDHSPWSPDPIENGKFINDRDAVKDLDVKPPPYQDPHKPNCDEIKRRIEHYNRAIAARELLTKKWFGGILNSGHAMRMEILKEERDKLQKRLERGDCKPC